ncbi:MAG: hypothetical protein V3V75_08985 [Thermoguttaceae bacterium]
MRPSSRAASGRRQGQLGCMKHILRLAQRPGNLGDGTLPPCHQ